MESDKPQDQALSIAYAVKRRMGKKMAAGGEVKGSKYEGAFKKAHGNIAESIMKKRMALGGAVEGVSQDEYDDFLSADMEATEPEELSYPTNETEHEMTPVEKRKSMISSIMSKMKSK